MIKRDTKHPVVHPDASSVLGGVKGVRFFVVVFLFDALEPRHSLALWKRPTPH